jgi:hypothetical protein
MTPFAGWRADAEGVRHTRRVAFLSPSFCYNTRRRYKEICKSLFGFSVSRLSIHFAFFFVCFL